MQAAIFDAAFAIRMAEAPKPAPKPGEVLVAVDAAGLCAGDLYIYLGRNPYVTYPRVGGHEIAGRIVGYGPDTSGPAIGTRVVVEPFIGCGHCYPCRVGKPNCCANLKIIGVHQDGGFADFVAAPVDHIHVVPDGLSAFKASFAEPVAIGVQACRRGQVTADDTVLILGAGPIGLALVEVARARGAKVYITDIVEDRLHTAADLGATAIPSGEGFLDEVMRITNGEGMPVVIEATGNVKAMESTVDLVAAGGRDCHRRPRQAGNDHQPSRSRPDPQGNDHRRLARQRRLLSGEPCAARQRRHPLSRYRDAFCARIRSESLRRSGRGSIPPAQGRVHQGIRMKLVTFQSSSGSPHVGILSGDAIADLTAAGLATTMLEIVEGGLNKLPALKKAAASAPAVPLASVRILAPIKPSKVLCSGINYKGHAEENPNAKMPTEPFFFAKLPTSVVGHEDKIVHSPRVKQLDYEVEFAVVIGKRLSRAAEADVMPAIFGYTLLNDVSARDVQFKDNQITLGKNFDGFAPIGPCIVTADELTDPDNVSLKTRLNGRTMQDGSTSDWLFRLPVLISYLSQTMTLLPGDIVTTGTPAGVGVFQNPQIFMKAGDVVEIEAEGIGILRNSIVAAA